jgi:CRP/FNR family transcriptional regulator, cyclic AMP receptor protein
LVSLHDSDAHALAFEREVSNWFRHPGLGVTTRRIPRNGGIYTSGDKDLAVYFVEAGSVKTGMFSRSGKACLLNVHIPGEVFGELCLVGMSERQDTAFAMRECVLRLSTRDRFLSMLRTAGLLEGFIAHLTKRSTEQQRRIADLMLLDATHRLAAILLQLARKLGTPGEPGTRIRQKISHQELSEMIGTTRPRVSELLQKFHTLHLVKAGLQGSLVVDEQALTTYLEETY